MMQLLPSEKLGLIYDEKNNLDQYHNNGPTDCFLEVDLDYPDKFHNWHND